MILPALSLRNASCAMARTPRAALLVSDDIRAALHDQFRLRAMPPTLVKGKVEPIQTWLVEAPTEADNAEQ